MYDIVYQLGFFRVLCMLSKNYCQGIFCVFRTIISQVRKLHTNDFHEMTKRGDIYYFILVFLAKNK
jgi:hypothetical protein